MPEQNNGNEENNFSNTEMSWKIGPREFIFKYLKYIPWIIICTLIAFVLGWLKIRYTTNIFPVSASMLIKDQSKSQGGDQRFDEMFLNQKSSNLNNEIQILKSRPVLQRVARDLGVQIRYYNKGKIRASLTYPDAPIRLEIPKLADPEAGFSFAISLLDDNQFSLGKEATRKIAFGQPFSVGRNTCVLFRNPFYNVKNLSSSDFLISYSSLSALVGYFLSDLSVLQVDNQATILSLSYRTENVELGKDLLNTLMSVYDSLTIEDKNRIANNSLRFIDDRLDTLKYELNNMESGVKTFAVSNDAYNIDAQSKMYLSGIEEYQGKISEAETRIKVLDWLLAYMEAPENRYKLVPTILGIDEKVLWGYVEQFNNLQLERDANLRTTTENNPLIRSMDASLEKVRNNTIQALKNVKQAYIIGKNNLVLQGETMQNQLKSMPDKSMRLVNIQRRQKILEDLYSFLLQKKLETSISSASTISNSKVIEPALASTKPIIPDRKKIYTIYLLTGILIPVGVIAGRELLRDKVSSRMDVEKRTKAPILAEIGHSDEDQALVVTRNSRRFIAEQFRILRSNLKYMTIKKENPIILVTSSFSSEGKSFISTNVAAVLALSGKKTVLMEFDIRKPKVLEGLGLKRKLGITNYIIGRATIDDIIMQVPGFRRFLRDCLRTHSAESGRIAAG